MLKQALIGTSVAAVLGGFVLGRDSWSYVATSVSSMRQAIKREVPIEFEVQRARDLVFQVDSEIRKCLHVIAEEEVNVDDLRKEVDLQAAAHQQSKDQILVQRRDLQEKKDTYSYAGRIYTVSEVEQDLADRFSRYRTVEETLQSRQQVLKAREHSLTAARRKLDSMLDSKEQLLVQIENLDARLKTLQASQVASTVNVDDSQIARTRQLIAHLNKQIEVRQKLVDGTGNVSGLIPIDVPSGPRADITAQIDQFFGAQPEVKSTVQSPAPNTAAL
ncbi:MAG: hypothetical protein V4719_18215 [Planctomycetota bacterium]